MLKSSPKLEASEHISCVFMHLASSFFFLDSEKAQSVEEELISSHREEASQLRKVISQKEDDLHKTVQKYEQVIQVLLKTHPICFNGVIL